MLTQDNSVSIATTYAMGWMTEEVRFYPDKSKILHSIPTGSWAHPASYIMGTRGSFLASKVTGA
jgi:hypothetical protein